MIRRIILENYMSHGRTVIEPAAGLTVLAGPNNCGKSAVISALMNLRGDGELDGHFMLRHEEKLCTVTVETDDGHVLVWKRKKASVVYLIDGVEVNRMGRGNLPDKLPEILRLPVIEPANSGKKFDLHFGLQKKPIFLIDSESDAARFFSASNDAERLLEMQQLQKERVKSARADQKKSKSELARIDGKLAALSPLEAIDVELAEAERLHGEVVRQMHRAIDLSRLIDAIDRLDREAARVGKIVAELGALRPPPVPHDTAAMALAMAKLNEARLATSRGRAAKFAMDGLRAPPVVEITAPLKELIDRLRNASASARRKQAFASTLRPLRELPAFQDDAALKKLVGVFGEATRSAAATSRRVEAINSLREPPSQSEIAPLEGLVLKMDRMASTAHVASTQKSLLMGLNDPPLPLDPGPLRELIARCNDSRKRMQQRRITHAATLAELSEAEREIDRWLCDNPACPLCGGETDRRRLLGAAPLARESVHA